MLAGYVPACAELSCPSRWTTRIVSSAWVAAHVSIIDPFQSASEVRTTS